MSVISNYYQLNVLHIAKEKCGGFAVRDTNGKAVLMLGAEEMAVHIVLGENQKYNPTTTRHHSVSVFATFSATKFLINEIIGRKTSSKSPFRIIFMA